MNKIISSLVWKFMERFGTVGIQFIIQIILARLLVPKDYGTIALITVFINVSNVFVQTGFNTALIQQKDVKDEDYSSVFWVSLFVAASCYLLLFICAPFIASFYKLRILENVLRVLGLTLFFGAYNSIQIAKISREFKFKNLFFSSIIGMMISGIIGIVMAINGYGIWAIVFQQLTNQLIISIVLRFKIDWRIKFCFNIERVKILFSFGYKLLLSSLIDTIYNNLYNLVIGKFYSSTQLGYYNRADQFPNLIVNNINGSIQSVILPAMAEHQNNIDIVREMVRKAMSLSSYIVFPIMIGLIACAEPLVLLLLTEKWLACVPYLQLLCFSYMLWPIHTANLQAINALGRSDIFLKLEIIKKIIGVIALGISIPFGVLMMVVMQIIVGLISTFINSFPNRKLLKYSYRHQIIDLLPSFINSILMGLTVIILDSIFVNINISVFFRLIFDIIIGASFYLIISLLTKNKNLDYIISQLKKLIAIRSR